jgi:hypothetical protein
MFCNALLQEFTWQVLTAKACPINIAFAACMLVFAIDDL